MRGRVRRESRLRAGRPTRRNEGFASLAVGFIFEAAANPHVVCPVTRARHLARPEEWRLGVAAGAALSTPILMRVTF